MPDDFPRLVTNNSAYRGDAGRRVAEITREDYDEAVRSKEARRLRNAAEAERLAKRAAGRQAELDAPIRGESAGFTAAKTAAELNAEDLPGLVAQARERNITQQDIGDSVIRAHNRVSTLSLSGEPMARGALLPEPHPDSLSRKAEAWKAAKLKALAKSANSVGEEASSIGSVASRVGSAGSTVLNAYGGVMGAIDARDQYRQMQTSPNKMNLRTGKIEKRLTYGGEM